METNKNNNIIGGGIIWWALSNTNFIIRTRTHAHTALSGGKSAKAQKSLWVRERVSNSIDKIYYFTKMVTVFILFRWIEIDASRLMLND